MHPENNEKIRCTLTRDNRAEFPNAFALGLPSELRDLYGGDLVFMRGPQSDDTPVTSLNFVIDGRGAFNRKDAPGGGPISIGNEADAFGMALLRASADAVMVGANTLNGESGHKWHLDFVFDMFPQMRGKEQLRRAFKTWRASLGKHDEHPPTYLMTNSGRLNFDAAIFHDPAIKVHIVTGEKGAAAIRENGVDLAALGADVLVFGEETLDEPLMMREIKREHGVDLLLHEGGRGVADALVRKGLIDQLFLTQMAHATADAPDVDASQLEYLFSTPDHAVPPQARLVTERVDATGNARLLSYALAGVPSF